MSKALTQLKVVQVAERGIIPAPRLCDLCASGAVLRGHARTPCGTSGVRLEEVICLFLGRAIEMDVTECNRFVDRFPTPEGGAALPAPGAAWVA